MKKITIILSILLLTFGCGLNLTLSPKEKVREFLTKYNNNDSEIIDELDDFVDTYEFNEKQKDKYKNILQKQYKDLKFDIIDENIKGDNATVDVKITVYDLYKAENSANLYLEEHPEKFDGKDSTFDKSLFNDYKLKLMDKTMETIDYNITFNLTKKDNVWDVDQLNESDLEKIHGVYNYENE